MMIRLPQDYTSPTRRVRGSVELQVSQYIKLASTLLVAGNGGVMECHVLGFRIFLFLGFL